MNLIHKEFLIALENGEEVEHKLPLDNEWFETSTNLSLTTFNNPDVEFRIKPKTVTLTYDVPKPFKPEIGEPYWFVFGCEPSHTHGNLLKIDCDMISMGAYRTKEDVIKVIEAQKEAIANSFANDLGDLDEK